MKFSVIGHKKIAVSIAHHFKKNGFELVAFYSNNVEKCVKCAIETFCKAYTNIEDVISESELIILAIDDILLKTSMRKIASFNPENKIFITLSYSQTSDLINIGNNNTYFSMFVPEVIDNNDITDLSKTTLLLEGCGKDYWDLYDELYIHNIKFEFIDKNKKWVYNISAKLVSDLIFTFCNLAGDALSEAGGELKNIKSFALNTVLEMFGNEHSIEKADFGDILDNLYLINPSSAKKIDSIYKVLKLMSK
ncbi:MAG: hypothetical protein E7404_08040 [Ruminococcaceae bacterium]|nr:hypothetical protein [Oscillospiraceae bacterium]